ncbi:MAG: hypothetical protein WDN28_26430 [Chthoniobacter sp.]
MTRLDEFLSRKPIRYMVSQKENRINFAEVIDGGRILLAKLPQGLIGRENSYLLGSLLLSKLQQMAMSRQRMRESERRDFWCYVDEFHCSSHSVDGGDSVRCAEVSRRAHSCPSRVAAVAGQ